MAVMSFVPGLRVTICMNGMEAKEYDNPHDEATTFLPWDFDLPACQERGPKIPYIVKYIEAIPGAKYEIAVDKYPALFSRRSHHIACKLLFDGREVGLRHEGTNKREDQQQRFTVVGFWAGGPMVGYAGHKFRFAPLNVGMLTP